MTDTEIREKIQYQIEKVKFHLAKMESHHEFAKVWIQSLEKRLDELGLKGEASEMIVNGWGRAWGWTRQHYFNRAKTLCGRIGYPYDVRIVLQWNCEEPCKICKKILERKQAAPGEEEK